MDNLSRQPIDLPEPDLAPAEVLSFPSLDALSNPARTPLRLCSVCRNLVPFEYFRIRGQVACESCAIRARIGRPAMNEAAFIAALFFGVCGSIFSLTLCAGFSSLTHVNPVYFVWFIGWVVGKAMKQGSNGVGGRRFQVAAAVLTYAGIGLAGVLSELIRALSRAESLPDSGLADVLKSALLSPAPHFGGDPVAAGIRFVVLAVGLWIAWEVTAAESIPVDGPFGAMVT